MNSPCQKPKLKRRSSSMFNLMEQNNLVQKDMAVSKVNAIRKNNMIRRNYRNDLIVKNRNIDLLNIYEESPVVKRSKECRFDEVKIESMDVDYSDSISKKDTDQENVLTNQPESQGRIANIKNKINTIRNNFRSIINTTKATENIEVKVEPKKPHIPVPKKNITNEKNISPLTEQNRFLNPVTINEQHKRLTQHNKIMRSFNSASNIKPRMVNADIGDSKVRNQPVSSILPKKTLRSSDSTASLKERKPSVNPIPRPAFKLGTRIVYNDRYLFENIQPNNSEITKFNKVIVKRKIAAHNLTGSLNSLTSINNSCWLKLIFL